MNCYCCNLVLEDSQPKTTQLCGHVIHTSCFIIEIMRNDIERLRCGECEQAVVTPTIYEIVYPPVQDSCKSLEETSEEFRNKIQIVIDKNKEYSKIESKFKRKIAPIVAEYKSHVKPQIAILKSYIKSKVNLIKKFEEYSYITKKYNALVRAYRGIYVEYNISEYELRTYLRREKNIVVRYRYSNCAHGVKNKFRIRI